MPEQDLEGMQNRIMTIMHGSNWRKLDIAKVVRDRDDEILCLVQAEVAAATEYQIGVAICNEKLGIWGLYIAKGGKQVYGDIYPTEQAAKDAIPGVLAELSHPPEAEAER